MVWEDRGVLPMAKETLLKHNPVVLMEKYHQHLLEEGIPVEQMILFGSQVTGKTHKGSDLDVAVVSKSFTGNAFDHLVRLAQLAADIDPLIEPHPFRPEELENRWDPLAVEIRKHGQRVL